MESQNKTTSSQARTLRTTGFMKQRQRNALNIKITPKQVTLFAELRSRDTRALPRIFRLFLILPKFLT